MPERLSTIGDQILARLEATNAARERALGESRQIIRLCANCIRAVHRGEFAEGERLADEARDRLGALGQALRGHPAIYWSGYVQDAQKEYAEARIVHGLIFWTQGEFDFVTGELRPVGELALPPGELGARLQINTEQVLLEAMRLSDELRRARREA